MEIQFDEESPGASGNTIVFDETPPEPVKSNEQVVASKLAQEPVLTGTFPNERPDQPLTMLPDAGGHMAAFEKGMADMQSMGLTEAVGTRAGIPSPISQPSAIENVYPYGHLAGEVAGLISPTGLVKGATQGLIKPAVGLGAKAVRFAADYLKNVAPLASLYGAMSGTAKQIPNPKAGIGDYAESIVHDAALNNLFSFGLMGGIKAGANQFKELTPAQLAMKKQFEDVGANPTIADLTKSPHWSAFESFFKYFPTSAGVMKNLVQNNLKGLREKMVKLEGTSGLTGEQVGADVQKQAGDIMGESDVVRGRINEKLSAMHEADKQKIADEMVKKIDDANAKIKGLDDASKQTIKGMLLSEFGGNADPAIYGEEAQAAIAKVQKMKSEMATSAWASAEQIGQGLNKPFGGLETALDEGLKKIANEPDNAAIISYLNKIKGTGRAEHEALLEQFKKALNMEGPVPPEIMTRLQNGESQKSIIDSLKGDRTVSDMVGLRTGISGRMSDANRAYQSGIPGAKGMVDYEGAVLRPILNALDNDLAKIGEGEGGNLGVAMRTALKASQDKFKFIDNKFIKGLRGPKGGTSEEAINYALIHLNPENIAFIKKEVGQAGMNPIRTQMGNRILGIEENNPGFDPSTIKRRAATFGKNTVDAVMGVGSYDKINKMADQLAVKPDLKTKLDFPMAEPFKATKLPLENGLFRQLVNTKTLPSSVIDLLVRPGDTTIAPRIVEKMGDKTRLHVAQAILERTFKETPDGFLNPSNLTKEWKRLGDETMKSWLSPQAYYEGKKLQAVANNLETAQKLSGQTSGTTPTLMIMRGMEKLAKAAGSLTMAVGGGRAATGIGAGGAGAAAYFGHPVGAASVIASAIGVNRAAHIYTSPTGLRWMTELLSHPDSKRVQVLTDQLAREIGAISKPTP